LTIILKDYEYFLSVQRIKDMFTTTTRLD